MRNRKGFTLIELMVVILIVGILAAVAVPLMRGRVDAAKWSEANASAGTIRSSLRAYFAEKGPNYTGYAADLVGKVAVFGAPLGFTSTDIDGHYFSNECYEISGVSVSGGVLNFTITVTAASSTTGEQPSTPASMTMDQNGDWQ